MLLTKKQKQYVAGCRQSEVGIITVIIMIIAPDAWRRHVTWNPLNAGAKMTDAVADFD